MADKARVNRIGREIQNVLLKYAGGTAHSAALMEIGELMNSARSHGGQAVFVMETVASIQAHAGMLFSERAHEDFPGGVKALRRLIFEEAQLLVTWQGLPPR